MEWIVALLLLALEGRESLREEGEKLLEDALRRDERGRKVLDALGALRTLVSLLQDADNLRPIIAALAGGSVNGERSPFGRACGDGLAGSSLDRPW